MDNCPNKPNGPDLGTCSATSDKPGVNCASDADCANGCSSNGLCIKDQRDADNDGAGDVCDGCPNDPTKTAPGICGCGIADTDTDTDGVLDCIDNCPATPNGPLFGTCMPGSDKAGSNCHSDADCVNGCSSNGTCSLNQEDKNADGRGDVCAP
jgi:hypothetical protein